MSAGRYEFSVVQDGIEVAGGSAPTKEDAWREAQHYGLQYAQDGPVLVTVKPEEEEE